MCLLPRLLPGIHWKIFGSERADRWQETKEGRKEQGRKTDAIRASNRLGARIYMYHSACPKV